MLRFLLLILPINVIANTCQPTEIAAENTADKFVGHWYVHSQIGPGGILATLLLCPELEVSDNGNGSYTSTLTGVYKGVNLISPHILVELSPGFYRLAANEPVIGYVVFYYNILASDPGFHRWHIGYVCLETPLRPVYIYYYIVRNMSIILTKEERDEIDTKFGEYHHSLNEPHTGCSIVPRVPKFPAFLKWIRNIF